jgi:cholesterol transport system auxiliary component
MRPLGAIGLLVCLLAGGCATPAPSVTWEHEYGLGPMPAATQPSQPARFGTLRIAALAAPGWLNSTDIYYRLLYEDPERVAAYSRARWVAPPPAMLAQLVQDALAGQGSWRAVIGPENPAQADYALRLHLLSFEQDFTAPKQSHGLLRLRAVLLNPSESIVAQRTFRFREPAASADAQGGTDALSRASRACAAALGRWLSQAVAH